MGIVHNTVGYPELKKIKSRLFEKGDGRGIDAWDALTKGFDFSYQDKRTSDLCNVWLGTWVQH